MKRLLVSALQTAVCLSLLLGLSARGDDKKPDPTGTWKWSMTTQNGQTRETTLKLKLDGEKLTGSVSGRNADTAIEDGKLKGDEITFKVVREFNGNKVTSKYAGKISGDEIKGKIESERDGQSQTRDWNAKREAAKKE